MWPPPPALVCALFPYVRMLYEHLRTHVTRAFVHGQVPARRQPVVRQEQLLLRDHPGRLQRLRRQQEQQQQQQQERQQRQGQPNHNDFDAVAAEFAMDTNPGWLICGALAMPTIARVMGAMLLHLSYAVPFVRIFIALRPPPPPPPPLPPPAAVVSRQLGLWECARNCGRSALGLRVSDRDNASTTDIRVVIGGDDGGSGGFGTTRFDRFLATSQALPWAASDPVWYDGFYIWVFGFIVH